MEDSTILFESIKEIGSLADELLVLNDQGPLSQGDTTAIKEGLVKMQAGLQQAFPALKRVRRDVFALQPAEPSVS